MSVPIQQQFEQFVNASYIEKLGYGRHFDAFAPDNIKAFLYDLEHFKLQLGKVKQKGNTHTFDVIDGLLKEI
jgi:UDP:flavonoid glycosyltransferase YjiC (YdhE family)